MAAAGITELRSHGSTELRNYGKLASRCYAKTTRQRDLGYARQLVNETTSRAADGCGFAVAMPTKGKCRKTKGRAVAGIMELRIYGITELQIGRSRLKAHCS